MKGDKFSAGLFCGFFSRLLLEMVVGASYSMDNVLALSWTGWETSLCQREITVKY